jgi:acyl-Coa thioesterase superfamily protein/acyl-CoA thioesterase superfamily protein
LSDAEREPLYRREARGFIPSELTRGPWDAGAQHGGAPAALIAGELQTLDEGGEVGVARITYEFLRPVPLAPLELELERGGGRRVRRARATLRADGKEVCIASALLMRRGDTAGVPAAERPLAPALPSPEASALARDEAPGGFARDANEIRFLEGSLRTPGPATAWFRLRVPVVDDQAPTPLQRAAAAADFGNGVSSMLDWDAYLFINADLSVYLEREPEGEWICLQSSTHLGPAGVATSESILYDSEGRVGRAVQSLLIGRRE